MDFEEAQAAVRQLKIRDEDGWIQCFDAGEVDPQIPRDPEKWYCGHGWVSWDDWLGGSRYLSFVDAREEVRKKRFKSKDAFRKWAGSSMQRRGGVPVDPHEEYGGSGWVDWFDWLGGPFWPFEEARGFVVKLGLKTKKEFQVDMHSTLSVQTTAVTFSAYPCQRQIFSRRTMRSDTTPNRTASCPIEG